MDTKLKNALLPRVNDPSLFYLNCWEGKEWKILVAIMCKFESLWKSGRPLNILSATFTNQVPGHIYIEAFKEAHVWEAIEGIDSIFPWKIV